MGISNVAAARDATLAPDAAEEILSGLARVFFPDGPFRDAAATSQSHEAKQATVFDDEARFRSLIEQLPAIVFLGSLEGGPAQAYVSPQIEAMLGYSPSEWLGDPLRWYASIHPEDKQRWSLDAARMFTSGEPLRSVYRVIAKDGRVVWFRCEAKMVRGGDGRLSYIQGIAFDVTELMEMQAQLQAAKEAAEEACRAKNEFLVNVSHEIRTPMNGIITMTELALETELSEEQSDYLKAVKYSADVLMLIITDILDFSKLEGQRVQLECHDFACRVLVGESLNTLAERAQQKRLKLLLQVSPDVPEIVQGDPERLQQILLHVVGNAIKFTERGEVKVSVDVETALPDGVVLHFKIVDSGIGIRPELQKVIFEPFTQGDGSLTRQYGGNGLGLTICARLVKLMHGHIWVESELGRGSTFHFTAHFGRAAGLGISPQPVPPMVPKAEPALA